MEVWKMQSRLIRLEGWWKGWNRGGVGAGKMGFRKSGLLYLTMVYNDNITVSSSLTCGGGLQFFESSKDGVLIFKKFGASCHFHISQGR